MHARRTLDALERNPLADRSSVIVFCDGPRSEEESGLVDAVVSEVSRKRRFGSLQVIRRESNLGLATSVTSGVTEVLATSNAAIVLEDDLVTSPSFLEYMNTGLRLFADEDRVISIHGYSYPSALEKPFFLRGADCWGWATWQRGWELYEPDGATLLQKLEDHGLTRLFDFNDTYPYTRMLRNQIAGQNDSWAVRWYASAFLADRLTLYPGRTLVQNIGTDGTGTNVGITDRYKDALAVAAPVLEGLTIAESSEARLAFEQFFRSGRTNHQTRRGLPPSLRQNLLGGLLRRMGIRGS